MTDNEKTEIPEDDATPDTAMTPDADPTAEDQAEDLVPAGALVTASDRARGMMARGQTYLMERQKREEDLLPTRFTGFLSRSIVLEEMGPPKSVHRVIGSVSVLIVAFIVWASFETLEERASAPGEVMPQSRIQPVQHLEGGIVSAVLTRNGALVEAGTPLIRLEEAMPRAELDALLSRHASLSLQAERMRSYALEDDADFSAYDAAYPALVADAVSVLAAQVNSRNAQSAVIDTQIRQLNNQVSGLRQQRLSAEVEIAAVAEELAMREDLLTRGNASKVVVLETRRSLARAEGEKARFDTEIATTRTAIAEAQGRRTELVEKLRNEALQEMGAVQSEAAELNEQLVRVRDRVARLTITAPVTGRVKGLTVHTGGGVIAPGATLMEIVPEGDHLIANVRISPRDIGHVTVGSHALVKIETYNFARYGGVSGTVTEVSASNFTDPEGNIYFEGLVELDQSYVGADPLSNRLAPGMTLTADIKTGEKSLLGYLIRPIYNTLSDSFSER